MFCTGENMRPENCLFAASRLIQFPGQKKVRPHVGESVTTDAFDGLSDVFGQRFFACKRYYFLVAQKYVAFPQRPTESPKLNGDPPQC